MAIVLLRVASPNTVPQAQELGWLAYILYNIYLYTYMSYIMSIHIILSYCTSKHTKKHQRTTVRIRRVEQLLKKSYQPPDLVHTWESKGAFWSVSRHRHHWQPLLVTGKLHGEPRYITQVCLSVTSSCLYLVSATHTRSLCETNQKLLGCFSWQLRSVVLVMFFEHNTWPWELSLSWCSKSLAGCSCSSEGWKLVYIII